MRSMFDVRVGNVDDPKDAELIKEASPLFKADKIRRPLLIGQGANDPRVKQAEAEQIVAAIEKNGGRVSYVLYPDGPRVCPPRKSDRLQRPRRGLPRREAGRSV